MSNNLLEHKLNITNYLNNIRNEVEHFYTNTTNMKNEMEKLAASYRDLEQQQHGCYDIMIKLKMDVLYNQQVIQKLQAIIASVLSNHVTSQEEQNRLANLVESCKTCEGNDQTKLMHAAAIQLQHDLAQHNCLNTSNHTGLQKILTGGNPNLLQNLMNGNSRNGNKNSPNQINNGNGINNNNSNNNNSSNPNNLLSILQNSSKNTQNGNLNQNDLGNNNNQPNSNNPIQNLLNLLNPQNNLNDNNSQMNQNNNSQVNGVSNGNNNPLANLLNSMNANQINGDNTSQTGQPDNNNGWGLICQKILI